MLTHQIITRSNVGEVVHYYEDGVDDYYTKQGDGARWQGRGAEALGLAGPVGTSRFHELLAGRVDPSAPVSRSSTRNDSRNRIALDLTFSAPKSVSMQALIAGDARIIAAHDLAVERALALAEERAQARHKVNGKSRVEETKNLVVAKFRHETSRAWDPQLHTHAVVMNLTQREDGSWRALKNDEIVKATKYLGAAYRTELGAELRRLGYELRVGPEGLFELAHIRREQIVAFSKRAEDIERALAERGTDRASATSAQKQIATLATRQAKGSIDRQTILEAWRSRARELGIDFQAEHQAGRDQSGLATEHPGASGPGRSASAAAEAAAARRGLRYAINHLTERQAIIEEGDLVKHALNHVIGAATPRSIYEEIQRLTRVGYLVRETPVFRPVDAGLDSRALTRAGWVAKLEEAGLSAEAARARVAQAIRHRGLVQAEHRYTTQTALERERRILKMERQGRGQVAPMMSTEAARQQLAPTKLNAGQREAILTITTTQNRIVGIQGHAGTGKSHMLREAKALVEVVRRTEVLLDPSNHRIVAVAPYESQRRALRELGVEAKTVASFLAARENLFDERSILIVDEAGTVPTRQMNQLLQLAEGRGARVVLVGDIRQTKAIEAGRPFEQLQEAGMQTATMTEIQRQKDPTLREAVRLAAVDRPRESLHQIKEVLQIRDHVERRRTIAADFARLSEADRARTIIVSGTNEGRREINSAVREELGLAGKGLTYMTLVRRDTTQAERSFAQNYNLGDLIQAEHDYPHVGMKRGVLYEVVDSGPGNRLRVRDAEGNEVAFSPKQLHRALSVYTPETSELARGDRVRVTRNDAALDIANGDRFEVMKATPASVTLTDGRRVVEIPADRPLHLDHAYATTVHSSQGTTADRILIDAATHSRTTTKDVYYVAISRARLEARIYTDEVEKLPQAVAREAHKHAALDLARARQATRHPVHQL
jgi:conjugative relaxase-like TrwC/TraI family protein